MSDGILGSIMYLNSQEVDNLLDSIEGGLVDQFTESVKRTVNKKGGGELGIPGFDVKGDLEASHEESREGVRKQTPVSRLASLRKALMTDEAFQYQYIDATSEEVRSALSEGQLVEVQGQLTVSAFGQFVDVASRMLNLGKAYGGLLSTSVKIDPDFEQKMRYFEDVANKGIAIYVRPAKIEKARLWFDFVCILNPDHLRVAKSELSGKVNVLARVKKIPARNEVIYLYELIPGGSSFITKEQFKALLKSIAKSGITERDLRLRHPSVLLSPIAMYS